MSKRDVVAVWKLVAVVSALIGLLGAGCANFSAFQKLQETDDALAAKYGVPVSVVGKLRSTLGIPVAKDLPGPDRIVPIGYEVYYDVLNGLGDVVDTTGYHYDTFPQVRVKKVNALPPGIFGPSPVAGPSEVNADGLIEILKLMGTMPGATNAVTP